MIMAKDQRTRPEMDNCRLFIGGSDEKEIRHLPLIGDGAFLFSKERKTGGKPGTEQLLLLFPPSIHVLSSSQIEKINLGAQFPAQVPEVASEL